MLTQAQIPLDSTVSFDLYPSAILGTGYKGAKVTAILDADMARYVGIDPAAMHANVYSTLPPGTPNDYRAYKYLKLTLANGQVTAIGIPWIKDETFLVASTRKVLLTFDSLSPADQNTLMLAISGVGLPIPAVSYPDPV